MKFFTVVLSLVLAATVFAAPTPVDSVTSEPPEDSCSDVCGLHRIEGAHNEREALCSVDGLQATLECAQCIDQTWPDTTWEDSAMAEYDRIVAACESKPQRVFRNSRHAEEGM